ncbi:MAG: hypothetical protein M3Y77_12635 [Actinomycetota bacterium]|nr:hypothetical protein [Actinomycetota bacterium]
MFGTIPLRSITKAKQRAWSLAMASLQSALADTLPAGVVVLIGAGFLTGVEAFGGTEAVVLLAFWGGLMAADAVGATASVLIVNANAAAAAVINRARLRRVLVERDCSRLGACGYPTLLRINCPLLSPLHAGCAYGHGCPPAILK